MKMGAQSNHIVEDAREANMSSTVLHIILQVSDTDNINAFIILFDQVHSCKVQNLKV